MAPINQKTDLTILRILSKLYPDPASELNFKNNYQLIVSVVLSAQCTDKKVNEVTPELFKEFPDFKTLSKASVLKLEKILRPVNYYKTKSRNLIGLAQRVVSEFAGEIPKTFDEITTLSGVGRKTASVVLGEMGVEYTLPVDTHVFRVSKRLGLSAGKNVVQVEQDLKTRFEAKSWRSLHHWLIFHGRRVCKARNPGCGECGLRKVCVSGNK